MNKKIILFAGLTLISLLGGLDSFVYAYRETRYIYHNGCGPYIEKHVEYTTSPTIYGVPQYAWNRMSHWEREDARYYYNMKKDAEAKACKDRQKRHVVTSTLDFISSLLKVSEPCQPTPVAHHKSTVYHEPVYSRPTVHKEIWETRKPLGGKSWRTVETRHEPIQVETHTTCTPIGSHLDICHTTQEVVKKPDVVVTKTITPDSEEICVAHNTLGFSTEECVGSSNH